MKISNNCCNLCNSDNFELVKSQLRDDKEKFRVYSCKSCAHVQLVPKPTPQEDKEFYDKNLQDKGRGKDIDYNKLSANNMFDTLRHLRLVEELGIGKESKILDIGAGYGFFATALCNSGYKNVTGFEISDQRRKIAAEMSPATMIDFDVNNPDKDIGKFDVITLFHVLEHMADPIKFLKNIFKSLSAKGIFICEVPNVDEKLLNVCSDYNDFYWIRAHLNYFNQQGLRFCFDRAGYKKVDIIYQQRYGLINLCNWLVAGKPQTDKPIFEINDHYGDLEKIYKQGLEAQGKSDAMIIVVRI